MAPPLICAMAILPRTLTGALSNASGSPKPWRVATAGRSSLVSLTSTAIASTASAAWYSVSAATTATASPSERIRSEASSGRRSGGSSPASGMKGCARSRSAAVQAATTPGKERAAPTSTCSPSPFGTPARRKARWSSPERRPSATKRPRPVKSGRSSRRRSGCPT